MKVPVVKLNLGEENQPVHVYKLILIITQSSNTNTCQILPQLRNTLIPKTTAKGCVETIK